MKKIFIPFMTLAIISSSASATSNTINFKGEVSDETCSVSINGNTSSPVVLLPTVSSSDLNAAGKTAGQVTFDIGLTGCTGSATETKISTVFAGNQVTDNGNLGNMGTAENVEIQILDTAGKAINLSDSFTGEGDLTLAANQTEASASYTAQYYSTSAASPGTVESTLQYAVTYQ